MTKQYKKPEDMIDYNKEFDTINGLANLEDIKKSSYLLKKLKKF